MNKTHQLRWNAAKLIYAALINSAISNNAVIMHDGEILPVEDLIIDFGDDNNHGSIYMKGDNCRYALFDADPDNDDGIHDTIKENNKFVKDNFKLYKEVVW